MGQERAIDLDSVGIAREGIAGGAITPGHLLELEADGEWIVHAAGGADAAPQRLFAVEDAKLGKNTTTAYAAGERVAAKSFPTGARVHAIAGAAITRGARLQSNGDGRLKALTGTGWLLGFAIEAAAQAGDRIIIEIA